MAEGNIGFFVEGMKQFDQASGSQHSNDWYNAMAWYGSLAEATDDWNNMDASTKTKYTNLMKNEEAYMGYLDAQATYKSDKTATNKSAMNAPKSKVDWNMYNNSRKK